MKEELRTVDIKVKTGLTPPETTLRPAASKDGNLGCLETLADEGTEPNKLRSQLNTNTCNLGTNFKRPRF